MRNLLVFTLLTGAFSGALRADFRYDSRIQLSGGNFGSRKPAVATHFIKGNRMATFIKDHATIVDLEKETILDIDFAKKNYLSTTFAQMKQTLSHPAAEATFQVASKSTGRTKSIGFWTENELVVTMTAPTIRILVESWILAMPGYGEVEEFRRRLALKLGYAYAAGMSDIAIAKPELFPGFDELGEMAHQIDDMPVESTIRMGGPDSGDLGEGNLLAASTEKAGLVAGALNRLGNLGRKKTAGDQDAAPPGMLIEINTDLSNFSSGPVDDSKFNVPTGFKQIQH
jgi:hypothetical protein